MRRTVQRTVAAGAIGLAALTLAAPADAKRRFKNGQVVCKSLGARQTSALWNTDQLVPPAKPFGYLQTIAAYSAKVTGTVWYATDRDVEEFSPTGVAFEGATTAISQRRPARKKGALTSRTEVQFETEKSSSIDTSFSFGVPPSFGISFGPKSGEKRTVTFSAKTSTRTAPSVQSLVVDGPNAFNPIPPKGLKYLRVRSAVAAGPGTGYYFTPWTSWGNFKDVAKTRDSKVPGLTGDCGDTAFVNTPPK